MKAYRCVNCGVISPLQDLNGKPLDKDRKCFRCGCKERKVVTLPDFSPTKKGRRRRFGKGGPIRSINISSK